MKKTFALLTIVVALFAIGAISQPAQAAVVGGAVLNADGDAVGGALVTIQQLDARRGQRPFVARVMSGRDGRFVFDRVPAGRYVVSCMTRQGGARALVAVREDGAARVQLVLQGRRVGDQDRNDR